MSTVDAEADRALHALDAAIRAFYQASQLGLQSGPFRLEGDYSNGSLRPRRVPH
jgi:hypothetical protein